MDTFAIYSERDIIEGLEAALWHMTDADDSTPDTVRMVVKAGQNRGRLRIWLQGLNRYGWDAGTGISISYTDTACVITRDALGKRKVSAPSKGGVLDLVLKPLESLWQDHGEPERVVVTITGTAITIDLAEEA